MAVAITERSAPAVEKLKPVKALSGFRRDPLGLFADVASRPFGMARTSFPGYKVLFITKPDDIHRVLVENARNYNKRAPMYKNARPFLGDGLTITEGGEDWKFRRRLMQPVFHHRHVRIVAEVTQRYLEDVLAERRRLAATGESLDIMKEMAELTMRIVCRSLFDTDVLATSTDLSRRLEAITAFAIKHLTFPVPPLFVPTPANRAFFDNVQYVKAVISGVLDRRLADPGQHDDLLDLLVGTLGQAGGDPGERLTREVLQEEMLSLFFAGHETLAHTMAWTWYLVASHPDAEAKLCRELDQVLGGRSATLDDLPNLIYAQMVLDEAMRLQPVIWVNMRRAIEEDRLGGQHVPAGTVVAWSPYVSNRMSEIWDDPAEFRPERHLPENAAERSRHAFAPFGEGPRICIGKSFATAEALLILGTLAQHHRINLLSNTPRVPELGFTSHPRGGVRATLTPRH